MSELLKSIGFDRVTKLMHYVFFYGYAVAELIYGIKDNLYWIDNIKVRDRRCFRFTPTGELRLLIQNNMHEWIASFRQMDMVANVAFVGELKVI